MSSSDVCTTSFPLHNGMKLPAVGLGTWQGLDSKVSNDELRDSIVHALHAGYRLLDTAQQYGTEPVVGEAIRASGIPRSEITLVTKLPNNLHHDPAGGLQRSLDALGLEYIDIFLMHWPCATTPDASATLGIDESPTFIETWKMMEKIVGPRCKSIGVSNFSQKTLDALLAEATIVPVVNQVELHALNPNHKLSAYCQEKEIVVMSWSTLGGGAQFAPRGGEILANPLFKNIASNHGCSTGVVSLSWAVQRGINVIPKSNSRARVEENIRLVTLTEAEMKELNEAYKTIGPLRIADHIQIMRGEKNGKSTLMGWTNEEYGWEDADGNWLL